MKLSTLIKQAKEDFEQWGYTVNSSCLNKLLEKHLTRAVTQALEEVIPEEREIPINDEMMLNMGFNEAVDKMEENKKQFLT